MFNKLHTSDYAMKSYQLAVNNLILGMLYKFDSFVADYG